MGAGIAQLAIEAGLNTIALEVDAGGAEAARERIAHFLARKVEKGQLEAAARDDALARLCLVLDTAELAGCELVIEAVFEDLAAKRAVFVSLEAACGADAILATNTSALSVGDVAAGLEHPDRVVGMHFFNPAPLMPLVEIVRAAQTRNAPPSRVSPPRRASRTTTTHVIATSQARFASVRPECPASPTTRAGTRMPPTRLIVLLPNASLTSADPRPVSPRRTAVYAFGRLVSTARTTMPTTTFETCQRSESTSAERTMPVLPSTISAIAGTINASGFHSAPSCTWGNRWCSAGRRAAATTYGIATVAKSAQAQAAGRSPRTSAPATNVAASATDPSTASSRRPIVTAPASAAETPTIAARLNTFEPRTTPRLTSFSPRVSATIA